MEAIGIIQWYALVTLLGVLWTPQFSRLFPSLPDKGYGLAKIFAPLFLVYVPWLINFIYPPIFTYNGLSFFLSLNIAGLLYLANKRERPKIPIQRILFSEGLFLFFFAFLFFQFGFHPEFFGGEKPMDINLLSYFYRWEGGAIEDPWFSGEGLHYYYFGYLLFASLAKVTGVSAVMAYPLALATSMAWMASLIFSLFCFLTTKIKKSFLLTFIFMFSTNLKAIWFFLRGPSFEMIEFWKTTRVFQNNEFAEFPLWSFLFGDLHPHVMNYPFVASGLLITLYGLRRRFDANLSFKFIFLGAFFYGAMLGINTWDFLLMGIVYSLLFLIEAYRRKNTSQTFTYGSSFFLTHFLGLILFLPMYFQLSSGRETLFTYYAGETNNLASYFFFVGHWVILFLLGMKVRKDKKFLPLLILFIGLMVLFENFFFMDRINTIFKGLTTVTWLLSLFSLSLFSDIKKRWLALLGIVLCLPSLSLLSGIIKSRPFGSHPYSVRGDNYLKRLEPEKHKLLQWIQTSIFGTPVLMEGHAKSFDYNGSSVSTLSGLPSFLGWENHVAIRGQSWPSIIKRKQFIEKVYRSPDALMVHQGLLEKNIRYLVVGKYERSQYPVSGLEKFEQFQDLFLPVSRFGDTILYKINEGKERGKN